MRRSKKFDNFMIVLKIIMAQFTAAYSLVMVCCAGAGLIYNGDSYGARISAMGAVFILSGISMTVGAILCIFRKPVPNYLSLIFSLVGLTACLITLYKLCIHADSAGWHSAADFTPASDIYITRVLPTTVPVALAVLTAVIQIVTARNRRDSRPSGSILN